MNRDKYPNAVKTDDGKLKSFTIILAGEDFWCPCGCNCFHKPNKAEPQIYKCNSCGAKYGPKK